MSEDYVGNMQLGCVWKMESQKLEIDQDLGSPKKELLKLVCMNDACSYQKIKVYHGQVRDLSQHSYKCRHMSAHTSVQGYECSHEGTNARTRV